MDDFFVRWGTGAGAGSWLGLGLVGKRDVDFLKGGWVGKVCFFVD